VTFKDLQKLIESHNGPNPKQTKAFQRLRDKNFWYWDVATHENKDRIYRGDCCFNHIIGQPRKDGVKKPLFDYELLLYRALTKPGFLNSNPSLHRNNPNNIKYPFKEKHVWVKKATGLGVTEFMLRFMAWLCLRNDDCKGSQMVIVTGPNQELAIKLIKRMKELFLHRLGITFDSKETVLELNGCSIEAYPSNHIDAFRSLTNPKFILLDEGDFMPKFQQEDVRSVSERYVGKSDPFIVMVSTPNAPGGLFQKIEQESFDTCLSQINPNAKKSVGVDAGFGSSKFAIVVTQFVDGKIQVIFAEEYERPNFQAMINRIWEIKQKCGYISNIYVDAANPEVWESLKREFNEPFNQQYIREQITECRKYNLHIEDRMVIVPVPFSIEGAKMLQHAKWLMEETETDGTSLIAIHKDRFHKLITGLRTVVANEYKLDKEVTSYDDILNAFRLSLQFYKRSKG
jgi:hypothetical protein